jgi:hypothetical protein
LKPLDGVGASHRHQSLFVELAVNSLILAV